MKRILTLTAVLLVSLSALAGNRFGIFVDSVTYDRCRSELESYRDQLCSEGLEALILHEAWTSPEQVKAEIVRLAADKRHPLEGVVFVGDIPIVMVREGQWLTTAFKMNEQRFPIFESSVASDRFYDDFDLRFEFLQKDETHPGVFYYRLSEEGSQHLHPDIYSARMKVPQIMIDRGEDPYVLMSRYLRKVVKAHREYNVLDHIDFFFGEGYNSEDLNIWRQKPRIWQEYFPLAFQRASGNRFLNFHQADQMKWNLFSELQRPGTDLFQFTEHGAPDTQYINGTGEGRSLPENLYLLKSWTARQYKKWKGTAEDERFQHAALDSVFHLSRDVVSDSAMAHYHLVDSVARRHSNIYQDELLGVRSNPRVIILNACYNGSFHDPEGYVAGVHVFGPGDCVVAQGNTVNALQDKLEDKLMGYLSTGLRIGLWHREVPYLECHLIGDPTFRFAPSDDAAALRAERLSDRLVKHPDDAAVWKSDLRSENALDRAAAIVHRGYAAREALAKAGKKSQVRKAQTLARDVSAEAMALLRDDVSWTVRICAFSVLSTMADENAPQAIVTAASDPCERVVRDACLLASAMAAPGRDSCIVRAMERLYNDHPEWARINWQSEDALTMIRGHEHLENETAKVADAGLKEMQRVYAMRTFRNYRYLGAVPALLSVATDASASEMMRTVACETLGWYNRTPEREKIAAKLQECLSGSSSMPQAVRAEMLKSVKRLQDK